MQCSADAVAGARRLPFPLPPPHVALNETAAHCPQPHPLSCAACAGAMVPFPVSWLLHPPPPPYAPTHRTTTHRSTHLQLTPTPDHCHLPSSPSLRLLRYLACFTNSAFLAARRPHTTSPFRALRVLPIDRTVDPSSPLSRLDLYPVAALRFRIAQHGWPSLRLVRRSTQQLLTLSLIKLLLIGDSGKSEGCSPATSATDNTRCRQIVSPSPFL